MSKIWSKAGIIQLIDGMVNEVRPSCATMLLITVPMPRMLIRNNHVTSKVLMLWLGMCPKTCWFLSLRVEVLGTVVCCNLRWRVAKGLQGGARVYAGGSVVFTDRRRVACG